MKTIAAAPSALISLFLIMGRGTSSYITVLDAPPDEWRKKMLRKKEGRKGEGETPRSKGEG